MNNVKEFFSSKISDRLFIAGNGFDLSIGLKTRYSDFANSDHWPKEFSDQYFFAYLNKYKKEEKWFDLETHLAEYERSQGNIRPIQLDSQKYYTNPENDKVFFRVLCDRLSDYLKKEQSKDIDENSVASRILKGVVENGFFGKFYTFNYTDMSIFADKLQLDIRGTDIEHIHGSLKDGIVLGVPEGIQLSAKYDFLYKTSSENYSSHPLPYSLGNASEIVFFGHSMSYNDYFYFKQFFEKQSVDSLKKEDGKKITFFTYDEESRLAIIRQLRFHLKDKLPQLFARNNIQFIKTNGSDTEKVDAFLQELEETNVENSIIFE